MQGLQRLVFKKWLIIKSFAKKYLVKSQLPLPQNAETKKYLKILGTKKLFH